MTATEQAQVIEELIQTVGELKQRIAALEIQEWGNMNIYEASAYLTRVHKVPGSVWTLYQLSSKGILRPDKVNGKLIYTKAQLDEYVRTNKRKSL
jgi:hypothetical protein